ncbi:MAG: dephospho-CoA kinase [Elusimicrobiaceae bacterium]|nr:dephospho-CoA kinase [Elusimicrobiaceae bacterium]
MNLRVKNKWVIGLTGSMLSGKSTALADFQAQGAATFSADEIVRQLYKKPRVQQRLENWFGTLEKEEISRQVFTNPSKRKQLERFIHPLVLKELAQKIKKSSQYLIVIEIPLLFEAGWEKMTDLNVLIMADPKTLLVRLKKRGLTRSAYEARLKAQWPEEKKAALADVIFFHKTKIDLKWKVQRFCKALDLLK